VEAHICYNCGNKGHLSCLPETFGSNRSSELIWPRGTLKIIIAEAVVATMDVRDVSKKPEQAKESGKAEENFQAGQW